CARGVFGSGLDYW
nr:immunoglobulin heavy chain junction region [Macaca mulatta]